MKRNLAMMAVLLATAFLAGAAYAWPIEICVQDINDCNDLALSIEPTAIPTIFKVNGYEYRCPDKQRRPGRSVYGTLDLGADNIFLSITQNGLRSNDYTGDFFSASILYIFQYGTLEGFYQGTQSTAKDGVIAIDGQAKILVTCPPRIS